MASAVSLSPGDEVVFSPRRPAAGRYFLRLLPPLLALPARKFVLDGEIVIRRGAGLISTPSAAHHLQPAASSAFTGDARDLHGLDLLVTSSFRNKGRSLADRPLFCATMALQEFAASNIKGKPTAGRSRKHVTPKLKKRRGRIMLSPASSDFATGEKWMREGAASGWDGRAPNLNANTCRERTGESRSNVFAPRTRGWRFRWARGAKVHQRSRRLQANSKTADSRKRPTDEVGSLLLVLQQEWRTRSHRLQRQLHPVKSAGAEVLLKLSWVAGFSGKAPAAQPLGRGPRDTECFR